MNYIRFTTFLPDPNSGRPIGLFQALGRMKNAGIMTDYEIDWAKSVFEWFSQNLKVPSTFSRSRKNHAKQVALCWYKSTAHEHINKMYELVEILRNHNVQGYIVFEDEYQAVAEPFIETKLTKVNQLFFK